MPGSFVTCHVSPTPGISCEAVPASMPLTDAGMRRHVHAGNHAAESFVSFIPLLGGPPHWDVDAFVCRSKSLPPAHDCGNARTTREIGYHLGPSPRLHVATTPMSATTAPNPPRIIAC